VLARERHLEALAMAGEKSALAERRLGEIELCAEELRLAQEALSRITGEFSADDLLGRSFPASASANRPRSWGSRSVLLLCWQRLFAGFIDAVAGGGGLDPGADLAGGLAGRGAGDGFRHQQAGKHFRYGKRGAALCTADRPALGCGVAGGRGCVRVFVCRRCRGAWLPKDVVRPLVLVLLVLVLVYTVARPEFGTLAGTRLAQGAGMAAGAGAGAVLGFYDGFFGPGAGSFMIFAFVRWFRLDFLHASGAAKIVNLATNAAALAVFRSQRPRVVGYRPGHGGIQHSRCNAWCAPGLRHGSGFVRGSFVVVLPC
jgi:hypothetical protein